MAKIIIRKKDYRKDSRYIDLVWDVYDKLEVKYQDSFQVLAEKLYLKERQLKDHRVLLAVLREDIDRLQDQLLTQGAEMVVLKEIQESIKSEITVCQKESK